jgi:mycothiol synthase
VLPPGYSARPLDLFETDGYVDGPDVDLAYAVVAAADRGVIEVADCTRESVRSDLTNPDAMREEHRLVLTGDGEAAGLLIIERDDQARTLFVDSYAVPAHGSALLAPLVAMGLEAAERRAEGDGWKVEAGTFAQDEVYIDILEQAGFSEIRRFWHMTIDLDPAQTSEPTAPVGVRITIAESDDDRRLLHRIDEIAFAEHFGFVPHPYEEWIPWFSDRRDARPDQWRIAWLDDEPVGLCMLDDSRADRGAGHVRILGVIPEARGRGIALWLLGSAFAQAAQEGRTAMTLSVDSDNTTGATALYERAGMRPERVIILFRRPLP